MTKSPIVKGALISYASILLNIAISFFYTPWMIKQIGVSDYGLYSLVTSFVSYFIIDFGLSKANTRFIVKYRAEGNDQMVSNMLGLTLRVYLIIDTVIFLILFISYFFLTEIFVGLTPEELAKLKILYVIAGSFSVLTFMFRPVDGAMYAFEMFVESQWISIIQRVGTVVLICIALYFHGGVYFLVLLNGATALLTQVVRYIVFKRKTRVKINWSYQEKKQLVDVFSFSVWAFGRGLAQRLRFSLIPSVLGIFCNTAEISLFSLGITFEATFYHLSSAINGLFMPKIARISHSQDRATMNDLMIRVGRIEFFIISLLFSAFLIFGKEFIHLWVGDEFASVFFIVICLVSANLIIYTQDTAENLVFVENQIKYTTIIIFICSVLGLIGSLCLASKFGAVGCAFCSGMALWVNTIIVSVFYHKKMDLDMIHFFKECHLKNCPIYVVVAVVGYFLSKLNPYTGWSGLIGAGAVYAILFSLVAYFVAFNDSERQLVKDVIKIKRNSTK